MTGPESLFAARIFRSLGHSSLLLAYTGPRVGSIKSAPRPGDFLRGQQDITAACGRRIAASSSLQALVNNIPTHLDTYLFKLLWS